jgi:hypothetical protein
MVNSPDLGELSKTLLDVVLVSVRHPTPAECPFPEGLREIYVRTIW